MKIEERWMMAGILGLVALLVASDVFTDAREGVILWHLSLEVLVGVLAVGGVFYLLWDGFQLRQSLRQEREDFLAFRREAEAWRRESRRYIEGLAQAIDQQLTKWKLTTAEKEVAFLLLKGFSSKEIAELRKTTEKTARVQSASIYAKAGISGRSELSAFFLEDLLVPLQPADELESGDRPLDPRHD